MESEISNLTSAKNRAWDKIKNNYPEFSALFRTEPISIQQVQNELVDDKQAIVQYLVGEEKVSAFVFTLSELRYTEIPVSKDSLYHAFRIVSPKFKRDAYRKDKTDFKISSLHRFYQIIFEPLEVYLQNIEQLTIMPDDVLNYLPFEMLVTSANKAEHDYDFANVDFLLENYLISYTPSLNSFRR